MRKLKIVQVSYGRDERSSDRLMKRGFTTRPGIPENHAYLGAIPAPGTQFFVYYDEPTDKNCRGSFRLVRAYPSGREEVIARGSAGTSHLHKGLGTLTFYGNDGDNSWSLHCDQEPLADRLPEPSVTPKILVLQTLSAGKDVCESALVGLGLKEDSDFRFFTYDDDLAPFMSKERQVLLFGTNHGDIDAARAIMRSLRAKNAKLYCLSTSSYKIPGADGSIEWSCNAEAVRNIVAAISKLI